MLCHAGRSRTMGQPDALKVAAYLVVSATTQSIRWYRNASKQVHTLTLLSWCIVHEIPRSSGCASSQLKQLKVRGCSTGACKPRRCLAILRLCAVEHLPQVFGAIFQNDAGLRSTSYPEHMTAQRSLTDGCALLFCLHLSSLSLPSFTAN